MPCQMAFSYPAEKIAHVKLTGVHTCTIQKQGEKSALLYKGTVDAGHLTGFGGAVPHNSSTSASLGHFSA